MTYTYSHTYTYGLRGDPSPLGVHLTTKLVGGGADLIVYFTRTYRTSKHKCPVCSNVHDLSRMCVSDPTGHVQDICYCPYGHLWTEHDGGVIHLYTYRAPELCPLCGETLEIDYGCLVIDYGGAAELEVRTLPDDMLPYRCPGCMEEGTLEDFKLMANHNSDVRVWRLGDG